MKTPVSEAAPVAAPGFSATLGVTIAYARPDRVLGEMKISARHLTRAAAIHVAVIVGFAEELATHGAALSRPAGKTAVTFETKTNFYKPCRSGVLSGEASPLHMADGLMVWQTSVYDAEGKLTAVISQTQLLVDDAAGAASAAEQEISMNVTPLHPKGGEAIGKTKRSGSNVSVAEERREQIAAAACDVIARKGFANATIREIAEAAGLHVPTMYQYVTSKDEVLELVYSWAMTRLRTDVYEAAEGLPTAREKLLAVLSAQVANSDRYRHKVGVLNRELKSLSPKARMRVLQEYQGLLRRIAELIAEGIERGEFRAVEPEVAANFLEAMCDVWPLRQFAVGKFGLAVFQREMAAFIEASLRAERRSP